MSPWCDVPQAEKGANTEGRDDLEAWIDGHASGDGPHVLSYPATVIDLYNESYNSRFLMGTRSAFIVFTEALFDVALFTLGFSCSMNRVQKKQEKMSRHLCCYAVSTSKPGILSLI
ncbi:hypothetical protein BGZ61DRAFT_479809 [Ilyonectria robusta]|uniref:uncharacterized protein n=1 Tax=Ilyonectria robusta TaxID=1079257 RepID=UPI001E8E3D73|nr:uncharacterized protein BGZ61DRAFT_479809 [Ilyonectria robusta]KAH8685034.1 hypothetical protein BGZ61DRAFT_479809 [Ilyonectria robusta]